MKKLFISILLSIFLVLPAYSADVDTDIDNDTKIDDAFLDMATDINGPVKCNGAGDCSAYVPTDEAFGSGWNGDTEAPRKSNLWNWGKVFDPDGDGDIDDVVVDATADDMADHQMRGFKIKGRNADATVTILNPVYWKPTDNEYHLSDADSAGTYPCRGFATANGSGGALTILIQGIYRDDSMTWPAANYGDTLYLSTAPATCDSVTCNGVTRTAPTASGNYLQVVGWIYDDDHVYVHCQRGYILP